MAALPDAGDEAAVVVHEKNADADPDLRNFSQSVPRHLCIGPQGPRSRLESAFEVVLKSEAKRLSSNSELGVVLLLLLHTRLFPAQAIQDSFDWMLARSALSSLVRPALAASPAPRLAYAPRLPFIKMASTAAAAGSQAGPVETAIREKVRPASRKRAATLATCPG